MPRTKCIVRINSLKPIEGAVKNGQAALDDSAVAEDFNVAGVNDVARVGTLAEGTGLWTGSVTWHTLTILSLKQIYKLKCHNKLIKKYFWNQKCFRAFLDTLYF